MPAEWFAREAMRTLRTGGVLVGVFFNRLSWRGALTHTRARIMGFPDYYSHSYPSWRRAMRVQGFEMVREVGCRWPPFPLTSNSRFLSFALAAESAIGLQKVTSLSPVVNFIAKKKVPSASS